MQKTGKSTQSIRGTTSTSKKALATYEEMKSLVDELYQQAYVELQDPNSYESQFDEKHEKIIKFLTLNEEWLIKYLESATKDFFDYAFGEYVFTAEELLDSKPSRQVASAILRLCEKYDEYQPDTQTYMADYAREQVSKFLNSL